MRYALLSSCSEIILTWTPSIQFYLYVFILTSFCFGKIVLEDEKATFKGPQKSVLQVTEGQPAYLDCKVSQIGKKTVMWLRHEEEIIQLISYGKFSFHDDKRFSVRYQHPDNWRLRINAVRKDDSGEYECQLPTHPPKKKLITLQVKEPSVMIRNEMGETLTEVYVSDGEDLSLECVVEPTSYYTPSKPFWNMNYTYLKINEGRIKTEEEKDENAVSLWLRFLPVQLGDSGTYSCSTKGNQISFIRVHVFNDSSSQSTCIKENWTIFLMISISTIVYINNLYK